MTKDQNKNESPYVCWVDHVSFLALARILFLRLQYPFTAIRYITISLQVKKIVERFLKSLKFENVYLFANNVSPHEEMAITNKTYDDTVSFIDQVIKPSESVTPMLSFIDERYNKETIDFFMKQEIAFEIDVPLRLFNCIIFQSQKTRGTAASKNIVLIKDNYWIDYFRSFYASHVIQVSAYPNIKEFINKIYVFFKLIVEIFLNGILLVLGKKINDQEFNASAKIAVLHAQGVNLEKKTDYFWFPGSGINSEQILLYFKYPTRPPSPEVLEFVNRNKIPWINLLPWKIGHKKLLGATAEFNRFPDKGYLKLLMQTLKTSIRILFFCLINRRRKLFGFWKFLTALLATINFFEAFFKTYNIKVHFAMHDGGRDMVAANIAIEVVGGIDLCTHWSSYDTTMLTMGKSHDVCFTWGPFFTKHFFSKPYYSFKNFVYSGYLFDRSFESCQKKSKKYRQQLLNEGAEFIICLFDQNNPIERPLWNQEVEKLYRRLLELVIKDKKLGLIIKPKKINPKVKLSAIASLLQEAETTKRCFVLMGDTFPNEASQASDLAIGVSVASTPTVEAALAGAKCITFDLESHYEHPFYKEGHHKIVFDDLDEMFETIARFRLEPLSRKGFGDYSFILPEIDPFRDHKASERIGIYIRVLLEEFVKGHNKARVINVANEFYRRQYGQDKVLERSLSSDATSVENMVDSIVLSKRGI